ncbi:hypothetical protein Ddc_17383 [Ditylenchus destructor]|nr:hypothetical protein Ddc_17383 [Ditylenchus destructor]
MTNLVLFKNNNSDDDRVVILPGDTEMVELEPHHRTKFAVIRQWFGEKIELVAKIHVVLLLMFGIAVLTLTQTVFHYRFHRWNLNAFHWLNTNTIAVRQLITIVGCVLMAIALKMRRPRLFWPFLLTNGLWALLMLTLFVIYFIQGPIIYGGYGFLKELLKDGARELFYVACYTFEMLLYFYMELVFWKAYKYMVRQNASQ